MEQCLPPSVLHALTDEKVMSTKEAWIITAGDEKALVIFTGPGRHYCLDSHVHYDSVDQTFDEAVKNPACGAPGYNMVQKYPRKVYPPPPPRGRV